MSAMAPTGGSDIFLIQHECFVLISGNSEGLVVRGSGCTPEMSDLHLLKMFELNEMLDLKHRVFVQLS